MVLLNNILLIKVFLVICGKFSLLTLTSLFNGDYQRVNIKKMAKLHKSSKTMKMLWINLSLIQKSKIQFLNIILSIVNHSGFRASRTLAKPVRSR